MLGNRFPSGARAVAAFLGVALCLEAGCTCTGVHLFSRISVTQTAETKTRLWAWSRADVAGLEIGVISYDEGARNWKMHLTDPEPFPNAVNVRGGVSAVSWKDASNAWHDRVYYVGTDGRVHEGGYDGSTFNWISRSDGPPDYAYYGPLFALARQVEKTGIQTHVAAIRENEPGRLTLDIIRPGSPYSVDFQSSQLLKATSNVFGAVFNGEPHFFVTTDAGQLMLYKDSGSGWQGSLVHGGPKALQGDGAAVAWSDGSRSWLSALVRDGDDEGRLLEARIDQGGSATWTIVEDGGHWGSWANTIAATPNDGGSDTPPGYDLAYAMDGVVRRKRFNGIAAEWLDLDDLPKPPDIQGDATGPVALAPASWNGTPSTGPEVYMVGAEVNDIGYAFVSRNGEDRWHNLLDPVVSTGEVAVNLLQHGGDHLTESAAHERNGTVLVAAARMPRDYKTAKASDVLAAWSIDDGHTFGRWTTFPSAYGNMEEGKLWMQGDPTVALLSDGLTGYVMFHEVRFSPSPVEDGCDATGVWICRSRISLYRGTQTSGQMSNVADTAGNLDGQWELTNPYTDKESCSSDALDYKSWFLDHPVVAASQDDTAHIAWFRDARAGEDSAVMYRALNAKGDKWLTPQSVVVSRGDSATGAAAPYIAADSTANTAYIMWHIGSQFAVATCSTVSPAPECAPPIRTLKDDSGSPAGLATMLQTASGDPFELRSPWWAFSASPTTSGRLFVVYALKNPAGVVNLRFIASENAGNDWTEPETIAPYAGSGNSAFGPTLAVLGDDTVVINYYEAVPAGSHNVLARILLRDPEGNWSTPLPRVLPMGFDLTLAPMKCIDGPGTGFVGDYHLFLGGLTHVHYMRADPVPGNPLCTGTCLWTAAVSDVCR